MLRGPTVARWVRIITLALCLHFVASTRGDLRMMQRLSLAWCRTVHRGAMWPIHGFYICPRCLRKHAVVWDESNEPLRTAPEPASQADLSIASTITLVR